MPFRLTEQGDIGRDFVTDVTVRPARALDVLLFDPVSGRADTELSSLALAAGINARAVLDRSAMPRDQDRIGETLVAPSLLDDAQDNPLGSAARYMERAVDTLIAAPLGAGSSRSWTLEDSRSTFAIAFGLDTKNRGLRDQLLGWGSHRLDAFDVTVPPDPGDILGDHFGVLPPLDPAVPPIDPADIGTLDDLFQRTCVLGVFAAMHEFGRAVADGPQEYTVANITQITPDRGCTGDRVHIRGTGFGATQPSNVELFFPAEIGGWVSVDVAPNDWNDTEITVTLPEGIGVGPVGFIEFNPNATPATEAGGRLAGEMGACFGPAPQLRAQTVIAKLGGIGKVSITQTPFNRFRGGSPKIDYFLANGAQHAVIRPNGPLLLQWSVNNADAVVVRKAKGAPAGLPPIPVGNQNLRDEILFSTVSGPGNWTGRYEVIATNPCGRVARTVEVQMRSRKALALAGGGAKGAFEVGAVRCLYDAFNFRPDLITGASVGALNAAKLAEGGPTALPELEQLWFGMQGPSDLFFVRGQINSILTQLGPNIRQMLQTTPLEELLGWAPAPTSTQVLNLNIAARSLGFVNSRVASMVGAGTFFTIFDILMAGLGFGLQLAKIVQAIDQLLLLPSLLLFDPTRDKITANITPSKIAASGIALRIVVNGLRSARVRYVDESGGFVDGGPAPGIIASLNASASIPIAFPPIRLPDGEDYVDGGVLENAPIEAAVRAGADSVIAILPSPAEIGVPLSAPMTLLPVAGRAVELLMDGSSRRQLAPFLGWGVPVTVIAPTFELGNLLVVDPGLIRINMDYGYMRAYDEMQDNETLRAAYRASSDAITRRRESVWYYEHWANGQYPKGFQRTGQIQPTGDAEQVERIRQEKRDLRDLVVARTSLSGAYVKQSVPTTIAKAWQEWEAHFFDPYFASPWDGWSSYPGKLLQPDTSPPPLP